MIFSFGLVQQFLVTFVIFIQIINDESSVLVIYARMCTRTHARRTLTGKGNIDLDKCSVTPFSNFCNQIANDLDIYNGIRLNIFMPIKKPMLDFL